MDITRKNILKVIRPIAVIILVIFTYLPTLIWMWERWFAPETYYGHGILIPFISLYIIWQRRQMLKDARVSSEKSGFIIVIVGLFVHIICALLKIYFISGFSFVFVIYGLFLLFFGKEVTRKLIFPIFLLLAMIPLPLVLIGNLTVKLKLFAAHGATFILNRIGFPSVQEGSIIKMPNSYIIVGAPCSGLRSLIALLTLGLLFAFAMKISYFKKGLLLLSSIPIAIASNILRIIMLAIVNDLYGEKAAGGFFHDFSGFLVFAFAFTGLWMASKMLSGPTEKDKNE
jgi:exosortase